LSVVSVDTRWVKNQCGYARFDMMKNFAATDAACRPMDLSTIKKNIDSGMIRTTAEFQRDMMLMFINAMMYNSVEHDVYQMAVEMYNDVMMHIEVVTS